MEALEPVDALDGCRTLGFVKDSSIAALEPEDGTMGEVMFGTSPVQLQHGPRPSILQ
ncbi:MAG TPA: hypothetical protein VGO47_15250 [Chlamydiales bacterium]|nr:hypothetical protein [Chlamydiales bacterium]